mmetsp:Transcript_16015/g.28490  ORF Transcript_16015/g.28490 Transcript_16015/m.28490 type:complete len:110 (+) Transcript_16015:593-922(+)
MQQEMQYSSSAQQPSSSRQVLHEFCSPREQHPVRGSKSSRLQTMPRSSADSHLPAFVLEQVVVPPPTRGLDFKERLDTASVGTLVLNSATKKTNKGSIRCKRSIVAKVA